MEVVVVVVLVVVVEVVGGVLLVAGAVLLWLPTGRAVTCIAGSFVSDGGGRTRSISMGSQVSLSDSIRN